MVHNDESSSNQHSTVEFSGKSHVPTRFTYFRGKHPVRRRVRNLIASGVYHIRAAMSARPHKCNVVAIFVRADRKRYPDSLLAFEEILGRLRGCHTQLITIDNLNPDRRLEEISKGRWEAGGDNSQWEFSGWKRGLELAADLKLEADVVLFANDSFLNHANIGFDRAWFNGAFNSITLRSIGDNALGRVCSSPDDHEIFGNQIREFIQTHFFALPAHVAWQLNLTPVSETELSVEFPTTFDGELFRLGSTQFSERFKAHIYDHFSTKWRGGIPLTSEFWPLIRPKIIAMINERLLSVNLLTLGLGLKHLGQLSALRGCCNTEISTAATASRDPQK